MSYQIDHTIKNNIRISAILPNYNSFVFLSTSIQSLVDQVEPFNEIIIVDDGSTDDSLTLIQSFLIKYDHIRLIKHDKNQGVCAALNRGIEEATGDYIIMCAADDWYHEEMVANAKRILLKFPTVGLVCGDAVVQHFEKKTSFRRVLNYHKNTFISPAEFKKMSRKRYVDFNGGGGMLMNRQAVLNAGMLHSALKWHSDWLLYFVVAFRQGIYYTGEIFVYINTQKNGYSEGKHNWKIQRQVIIDTVKTIGQYHKELWHDFKEAALLPNYAIRSIPLFLFYPVLRQFFSLHLLWKLVLNNKIVVRIGRLFPYDMILSMRKLLRA